MIYVPILDGYEAVPTSVKSPHGFGRTRADAARDLFERIMDDADPAYNEALAHLREFALDRAKSQGRSADYQSGVIAAFMEIMR